MCKDDQAGKERTLGSGKYILAFKSSNGSNLLPSLGPNIIGILIQLKSPNNFNIVSLCYRSSFTYLYSGSYSVVTIHTYTPIVQNKGFW